MSLTTCSNETCSDQNNLLQTKQNMLSFATALDINHQLPQRHVQQEQPEQQHIYPNTSVNHQGITFRPDTLIYASATVIDNIWFGQIPRKASPPSSEVGAAVASAPATGHVLTALFIREILMRSRASLPMMQLALYYILKIRKPMLSQIQYQIQQQQQYPSQPNIDNVIFCRKRMFIAALMAAGKFLNDKNYRNQTWAMIANLDVKEINRAELIFLRLIDYELYVSKQFYEWWKCLLHRFLMTGKFLTRSAAMLNGQPQPPQMSYMSKEPLYAQHNDISHYIQRIQEEKQIESWYYSSLANQQQQQQQQQQNHTTLPVCNCPPYYACLSYSNPDIQPGDQQEVEDNATVGKKRSFQPSSIASQDEPVRKSRSKHTSL